MSNTDSGYHWEDVEHLLNDLRADGYEVVDVQTNTSEPDDSKLLMIAVGRNE